MQLQEADGVLSLGALGAGRDPAGPLQGTEVELVCAQSNFCQPTCFSAARNVS